jgi:GTPase SAR1 family protein
MKHLRCVVVGDIPIGKICLFLTSITNAFPSEYLKKPFNNFSVNARGQGLTDQITSFGTLKGEGNCNKLRPLTYPQTDVFMILLSLVEPKSLENVQNEWISELQQDCPNTSSILVETKSDMREEFVQQCERIYE